MAMSKLEYFRELERRSEAGLFPAARPSEAADGGVQCLYRTGDGRACAFGVLIPDERYEPWMEGRWARYLILEDGLSGVVPDGLNANDVEQIQRCHDDLARALRGGWDHEAFMVNLRALECFREFAGAEGAPA